MEGLKNQALKALMDYDWPGNVREMENALARAVILSKGKKIDLENLPEKIQKAADQPQSPSKKALINELPPQGISLQEMELELILRTLEKCEGNKSLAAKHLGISRKALYQKMERYGITPPEKNTSGNGGKGMLD